MRREAKRHAALAYGEETGQLVAGCGMKFTGRNSRLQMARAGLEGRVIRGRHVVERVKELRPRSAAPTPCRQ